MGERERERILRNSRRLKAFEEILWGQDNVTIHTDLLNLLYNKRTRIQMMVRWRLVLEEIHPKVLHLVGKKNDAADALLGLDMANNNDDELES